MRAEKRFRAYGIGALGLAVLALCFILFVLLARGIDGFQQAQVELPITFDATALAMEKDQALSSLPPSSFNPLIQESLKKQFPEVTDRKDLRDLSALVATGNGVRLRQALAAHPEWLGKTVPLWLPAGGNADLYLKGNTEKLNDNQQQWLKKLQQEGKIKTVFNTTFFTQGDSRSPEQAGFLGAITGSLLTLVVCLAWVFPIGVATAVFLEEFSRKNRFTDFLEVNINNLAAVPSIVFGLLGLAVYINLMGLPRSAPIVGGLTLALMILPVIIIATRTAITAIPGSIRDAARALGASPVQVVWHHVLPLAMPGIMTGTILGLARAIGETAPLLMIGMVAFVADIPTGFTSPATAMPVQIYLWASSPEAGFAEKTAAGILVLLMLLLLMNALAIVLRKKFEVRW